MKNIDNANIILFSDFQKLKENVERMRTSCLLRN